MTTDPFDDDYDDEPLERDDEIVDEIAVELAMNGKRVNLNRKEAAEAFARLDAKGLSASEIAERLHTSERSVVRWRAGVARPSRRTDRPRGQTMTTSAKTMRDYLDEAAATDDKRIKRQAGKVEDEFRKLRAMQDEYDQRSAARERVAELEQQLAEARSAAGLGRKSAGTAIRTSNGELRQIREWAQANGYTVSDRGRVAAAIVEDYYRQRSA